MATDPATMCNILVGLEGVRVVKVIECEEGVVEVTIETVENKIPCPACGSIASLKERRPTKLTDVYAFGRKVELIWLKRRLQCSNEACGTSTFTEVNPSIASARLKLTTRAARWAVEQVGRHGRSISEVSGDLGCNWHTVNNFRNGW